MIRIPNPYQTKIGLPNGSGPFFPETKEGDSVAVYAAPSRITQQDPAVGVIVNLKSINLTPHEARQLAKALAHHADQAEGTAQ